MALTTLGLAFAVPVGWTQQLPPSTQRADSQAWRAIDQRIQLVWSEFCALLRAGDIEGALQYVAEGGPREQYAEVLRSLAAAVRQLPRSWSEAKMIDAFGKYARYSLVVTDENGDRLLHELVFVRDDDGRWLLSSL